MDKYIVTVTPEGDHRLYFPTQENAENVYQALRKVGYDDMGWSSPCNYLGMIMTLDEEKGRWELYVPFLDHPEVEPQEEHLLITKLWRGEKARWEGREVEIER